MMPELLLATPWDAPALGCPTWELQEYSEAALALALVTPGHHTIKVAPLADKRLLQDSGFYYCDTLIETACRPAQLRPLADGAAQPPATIARAPDAGLALAICHGAFAHGRFHRDFNIPFDRAAERYDKWLRQLLAEQQVFGLYWQDELAGFIGYHGNSLVLHAVAESFRGRGLARLWWHQVVQTLFSDGQIEVTSSISAGNLAVLNLYASLGFSFKNPQDIYHRIVP